MDSIFIEGLSVNAIIGCLEWERRVQQKVVIDLTLYSDCAKAALTDNINDALDYVQVVEKVIQFVQCSEFQLIEALADGVAQLLLKEFTCQRVRIRLQKPGALPQTPMVGILIERSQPV